MLHEKRRFFLDVMILVVGIGLAILVQNLHSTIHDNNQRLEIGRLERSEYQWRSLYLSCNSAGAQESQDNEVRRLCDEVVPQLQVELEELRDNTSTTQEDL